MTRSIRRTLGIVLAACVIAGSGCGNRKDDNQPNPELKIPDIKPSSRTGSKGLVKDPTKDPTK
jgi:hypothetical protein